MKSIIIGIAGGTGSGKTTLTERLRDHFGADEVSDSFRTGDEIYRGSTWYSTDYR